MSAYRCWKCENQYTTDNMSPVCSSCFAWERDRARKQADSLIADITGMGYDAALMRRSIALLQSRLDEAREGHEDQTHSLNAQVVRMMRERDDARGDADRRAEIIRDMEKTIKVLRSIISPCTAGPDGTKMCHDSCIVCGPVRP